MINIHLNELNISQQNKERIDCAIQRGLNTEEWAAVAQLSGGLTGPPVYQLLVNNKSYVVKLENTNDVNFDLVRNYEIVKAVSSQGISPRVYFTDAKTGVILMQYIDSKSRPVAALSVMKLAALIRKLHDENSFASWKPITAVLDHFYKQLPIGYQDLNIIKKCVDEVQALEPNIFDPADVRSCHGDLNPNNVLFDGDNYLLVDWQAASPQSFYFDLSCVATFFYFYDENLCGLLLNHYLSREPTELENAKYFLMRCFAEIYYGIGFISIGVNGNQKIPMPTEESIKNLPSYLEFMQSIGSGKVNLAEAETQKWFDFVFLKTVSEKMASQKFKVACELIRLAQKR